jgi:hypothetical protein
LTDFDIYEFVHKAINSAKKVGLKRVDHIYITKSELDFIKSLDDIKLEKIAFVLLALAKYHNEVSGEDNNMVYLKLSEVKNMARINMNRIDFEYFYANLYDVGVLQRNTSPVSTIQIVDFVSQNPDDEIAFEMNEEDYLELAYVYLSWKNEGKGYARCEKCNRLMRQGKTRPKKYCEECAKYEPIIKKNVVCIDCGVEFEVDGSNKRTCRCDECQHRKQLEYQRASMEKSRKKNM